VFLVQGESICILTATRRKTILLRTKDMYKTPKCVAYLKSRIVRRVSLAIDSGSFEIKFSPRYNLFRLRHSPSPSEIFSSYVFDVCVCVQIHIIVSVR
jgi:hypothetical protein